MWAEKEEQDRDRDQERVAEMEKERREAKGNEDDLRAKIAELKAQLLAMETEASLKETASERTREDRF
ncbi:hypothetical protein T484DRAFT_1861532 [Baffinella frigidus]|nr:hypothetical protein T484DRAFT_1861532 [Cryptophyta sp. CCMP2293]